MLGTGFLTTVECDLKFTYSVFLEQNTGFCVCISFWMYCQVCCNSNDQTDIITCNINANWNIHCIMFCITRLLLLITYLQLTRRLENSVCTRLAGRFVSIVYSIKILLLFILYEFKIMHILQISRIY